MKTFALTLAAAATLAAGTAFAAPIDEVAKEKTQPVQIVSAPELSTRGQGAVTNGEEDGRTTAAYTDSVRIVQYPNAERPAFDRGQ
ncbi:MAG TPA: hypothetical protein VF406_06175 [Thermodesulfobacteriota bacterium]